MESIGLVLEGGGMRGIYTAGVLEHFGEQNVYFPYNIGVSAGTCLAASYLSRQQGRNRVVNVQWVSDPRYLSWGNMWKKGELFGMDFIFDEIPNSLVPFDFDAFDRSSEQLVIAVTDCNTGKTLYYDRNDASFNLLHLLRASSSLPFIAPIVHHDGKELLDGGISDPIPLRHSEQNGNKRNVVVLTRDAAYRKSRNRFGWAIKLKYSRYPKFVETMLNRHNIYNDTLDYIEEQERLGNIFVIRPEMAPDVGRMERNPTKLDALFWQGYEDAKRLLPQLKEWMGK